MTLLGKIATFATELPNVVLLEGASWPLPGTLFEGMAAKSPHKARTRPAQGAAQGSFGQRADRTKKSMELHTGISSKLCRANADVWLRSTIFSIPPHRRRPELALPESRVVQKHNILQHSSSQKTTRADASRTKFCQKALNSKFQLTEEPSSWCFQNQAWFRNAPCCSIPVHRKRPELTLPESRFVITYCIYRISARRRLPELTLPEWRSLSKHWIYQHSSSQQISGADASWIKFYP